MLGRAAFRAIFFVPVIISTGIMESINASDTVSSNAGNGIDDGTGQSSANEIISVLDVKNLFANMKVGSEIVTYVVDLVNNVYNIINYSGVQMLIFLAGLQSISPSIYEASQIEGATGWETFWKITFPMISPMILVNAIYSAINAFTRSSNSTMRYIEGKSQQVPLMAASSWIYFAVVMLIIAVVAGILSTFIFYQRRD
jgi:ABC-type sugar transport system permease subunit